jgi:uncharacterized protein (DUF58 family)
MKSIPDDIFKKIRRVQITTARLVSDVFAGEYKSVFKGRGMEFCEVREYQIGDDLRSIDWNVTARAGKPFVKRFVEERELTVMFLFDASASCDFGTVQKTKREIAAEVASVLAASATRNNDKVGLIIFTDKIEEFIPPKKGIRHVGRIIRELLYYEPEGKGTDIPLCLEYLNKVIPKSTVSFLVSDFYATGLKKPLAIACKKHDLVAMTVTDPRDLEMPDSGLVRLTAAETGKTYLVDSSSPDIRQEYKERNAAQAIERKKLFYSVNVDSIDISTASPYTESLIKFFKTRKTRR